MEAVVDEKAIKELARRLAKDLKTDQDLNVLSLALKKVAVEAALDPRWMNTCAMRNTRPKGVAQATAATVGPLDA